MRVGLSLLVFDKVARQINEGFNNKLDINYGSISVVLAYLLSRKKELLERFRAKVENELYYREILITALLFQKKELDLKNIIISQPDQYRFLQELLALKQQLDVTQLTSLQTAEFSLEETMPKLMKRCTLAVGHEQIRYLIFSPEEPVASLQSSNSSETGYFLSILPKYKVMVMEAEEFLSMNSQNPSLTVFFYIKHFLKNIVDVKKESFERVYLPEVQADDKSFFGDLGDKLGGSCLLKERLSLGWEGGLSNSVIYSPKHRDLVLQRPFILAVLSGSIERAV